MAKKGKDRNDMQRQEQLRQDVNNPTSSRDQSPGSQDREEVQHLRNQPTLGKAHQPETENTANRNKEQDTQRTANPGRQDRSAALGQEEQDNDDDQSSIRNRESGRDQSSSR